MAQKEIKKVRIIEKERMKERKKKDRKNKRKERKNKKSLAFYRKDP
jgi:hypothetical protein